MNYETKRDVFEVALNHATKTGWVDYGQLSDRYDDALPDNLPVIPEAVGEYIKRFKDNLLTEPLFVIFLTIQHNINKDNPPDVEVENWIIDHGDTFALAWVLGVWRVDGTGEIVNLK